MADRFEDQGDEGVGLGSDLLPTPGLGRVLRDDPVAVGPLGPVLGGLGRLSEAEDLLELVDDQEEVLAVGECG